MNLIDELRRDFARHGASYKNLALWALATYRFGRWANMQSEPLRSAGGKLYGCLLVLVEMASGITLHREVTLGSDFHLVHAGNIKIHPKCVIGDRVGIMQDVTLGEGERPGAPNVGSDVFIGAGAKVLGPIHIGDGARVAANSLVISDVPAGATAIGVPARILHYTGRDHANAQPAAQLPLPARDECAHLVLSRAGA